MNNNIIFFYPDRNIIPIRIKKNDKILANITRLKKIMEIALKDISSEWHEILEYGLEDIMDDLSHINDSELCPSRSNIFEFARLTKLENTRVIILGQDPYPKKKDAHGLAFSSPIQVPRTLCNICHCLAKSNLMPVRTRKNKTTGNLSGWAKQGVLLLNVTLTTKAGESNAHVDIWKGYGLRLLTNICKCLSTPPIILLWGNYAKALERPLLENLSDVSKHPIIMKWAHPSFVAQKRLSEANKFINCPHFVDVNKILIKRKQTPIDWNLIIN